MRHWRPWLISLSVTGGIFWYLFSQIDPAELIDTARSMSPRYLGTFVALLLTGAVARAVRFWLLLDRAAPLRLLTMIVMARNLFVDLLPARLGELSYVYLLTQRGGRPAEDGLASLFLAVLFDLVALAPLLILAILVVGGDGTLSVPILATAAVTLGALAFTVMRIAVPVGTWIAGWVTPDGAVPWRARLADLIHRTVEALRDVQRRQIFGRVLLVSMVVRLCKFGSYYFLVLAIMTPLGYTIDGLGFFRVFLGVVSAELAAALPIHGIGGFGTFEAAWALSFSQLGFSTEHAIMSGILAHATSQAVEYSLGIAALLYVMRPGTAQPPRATRARDRTAA
jgi:uncharacterized protein (TIRG00374 family)